MVLKKQVAPNANVTKNINALLTLHYLSLYLSPPSLSPSLPPPPSKVVPRGSADRTGRIRVGDQILRVNNTDAVGLNVTDLRNIIIGEQVCIRQHSSAYLHVSIRIAYVQLTSAYV